jgi:hypothetical protein
VRGALSACASHRRGRVRARLRTVWRQPTNTTVHARMLVGARLPSSRASPGTAPHNVEAADTPILSYLGFDACRCASPIITGESDRLRMVWWRPATTSVAGGSSGALAKALGESSA